MNEAANEIRFDGLDGLDDCTFQADPRTPRAVREMPEPTTRVENGVTITVYPPVEPRSGQKMRTRTKGATPGQGWLIHRTREVLAYQEQNSAPSVEDFAREFNSRHSSNPQQPELDPFVDMHEVAEPETAPDRQPVEAGKAAFVADLHRRMAQVKTMRSSLAVEAKALNEEFKTALPARKQAIRKRHAEIKGWSPAFPFVFRRLYVPMDSAKLAETGFHGWLIRQQIDGQVRTVVASPVGSSLGEYLTVRAEKYPNGGVIPWHQVKAMLSTDFQFVIEISQVG